MKTSTGLKVEKQHQQALLFPSRPVDQVMNSHALLFPNLRLNHTEQMQAIVGSSSQGIIQPVHLLVKLYH